jgi:hypothetical protein
MLQEGFLHGVLVINITNQYITKHFEKVLHEIELRTNQSENRYSNWIFQMKKLEESLLS